MSYVRLAIAATLFERLCGPFFFRHLSPRCRGSCIAIHCFLDGNGRTQRAFLEILATEAGHQIDLARIDPDAWNAAAASGFHTQDYRLLAQVIAAALVRVAR